MNKIFTKLLIIQFLFVNIYFTNLYAINDIKNTSYINSQNITYNENSKILEFGKDSLINLNDITILANKGIIDYKNNKIEIFGNFYLYQESNILSGNGLIADTKIKNFKSKNISFIYNNELKVDASKVEKLKDDIFFYNNFLTPCKIDGYFNCPTWSLKISKTKYTIDEDKFTHFDTFLQIADKKLFYIPYFTHYGTKAPRKSGFLTPTIEFNLIGAGSSIQLPFYIPLTTYSDLEIKPKITIYPSEFKFANDYRIDSKYNTKLSGGDLNLDLATIKSNNESSIYNSLKLNTSQILNKNTTLEFNGLITNSLSSSRSINEDQINYESTYLRINRYNLISANDLLISEINTVTAFDDADYGLIPYQIPNITYANFINIKDNMHLTNKLNYYYIRRDKANSDYASELTKFSIANDILDYHYFSRNTKIINKFELYNSFKDARYASNESLNNTFHEYNAKFSTDFSYLNKIFKPRLKVILVEDFGSSKSINEDSSSITFNYSNLFDENRFFGNDLLDSSSRLVYGVEVKQSLLDSKLEFKLGQSYDFKLNNDYLKKIKQNQKFSDYVLEAKIKKDNITFEIDSRLDNKSLSKKEMNYGIRFPKYSTTFIYNETSKNAFLYSSDDSKSLKMKSSKELNNNMKLLINTNLDLKNNYKPYETNLTIKIFDDCSELDISYINSQYSDNFNTTPNETISLTFSMDYLGFFGYEQNADLFFKKEGEFNYGINN